MISRVMVSATQSARSLPELFRSPSALHRRRRAAHHHRHNDLLRFVDDASGATPARLDAVVVPTARSFDETGAILQQHADLAARLGAVLLLLCSKKAAAARVPATLLTHPAAVLAVNVDVPLMALLPSFDTSRHTLARELEWDVPAKRNLGLLFGAALGWDQLLFLDDDVQVGPDGSTGRDLSVRTVRIALAAMAHDDSLKVVGWPATDFPDNSVVCHARRLFGEPQSVFTGAGAMLVRRDAATPFFPHVYNEDWLFQHELLRRVDRPKRERSPIGEAGEARQAPYDPFSVKRAAREELGDVLAEGLMGLLDRRKRDFGDARRVAFWQRAVEQRHQMIKDLRAAAADAERLHGPYLGSLRRHRSPLGSVGRRALRAQVVEALDAAEARLTARPADELAPLMVEFLVTWRADQRRWRRRLKDLQAGPVVSELRRLLGAGNARHNAAAAQWLGRIGLPDSSTAAPTPAQTGPTEPTTGEIDMVAT